MRKGLWIVVACLAVTSSARAAAPFVDLDIARTPRGDLRVEYRADRAQPALKFALSTPLRRDLWQPDAADVALRADALALAVPAARIGITVVADRAEIDRVFPQSFALSPGASAVNLDSFVTTAPALRRVTLHHAIDPATRRCRERYTPAGRLASGPGGRFVVVAVDGAECRRLEARIARGEPLGADDADLTRAMAEAAGVANASAWRLLSRESPRAPLILAKLFESPGTPSFRASAGWHDTITTSLRGNGWTAQPLSPGHRDLLLQTFAHEVVHRWVGIRIRIAGERSPWLHEGAAEYLSHLALVRSGDETDEAARRSFGRRITRCVEVTKGRSLLDTPELAVGSAPYDCGVLVQLAYDAAMGGASGRGASLLDTWRELARRSERAPVTLDVDGFLSRAPRARAALEPLFAGGGSQDPAAWRERLRALGLGVTVEPVTEPTQLTMALLTPLLSRACGGGRVGFYTFPSHLRLDTGGRDCAHQPRDALVRYVESVDVIEDPAGALAAVIARCATPGADVRLVAPDRSTTVRLACVDDLALPQAFRLTALPASRPLTPDR